MGAELGIRPELQKCPGVRRGRGCEPKPPPPSPDAPRVLRTGPGHLCPPGTHLGPCKPPPPPPHPPWASEGRCVRVHMRARSCRLSVSPRTAARQAPLSLGCSPEHWSRLPFPTPGESS